MVYLATRRVGDLVWVRVCDFMPPNVISSRARSKKPASRNPRAGPFIHSLGRSNDDTHTTTSELAPGRSGLGAHAGAGRPAGFGQSDDRPYAGGSAFPADFDAQSSRGRSRSTRSRIWVDGPRRDHAPPDRPRRASARSRAAEVPVDTRPDGSRSARSRRTRASCSPGAECGGRSAPSSSDRAISARELTRALASSISGPSQVAADQPRSGWAPLQVLRDHVDVLKCRCSRLSSYARFAPAAL